MRKMLLGSRKGLLLTLATIVLLILMLAQIMTYVSTQIDYGTLSSSIATTSAVTNFLTSMKGSAPNFLHNSLSNAMAALVAYESTPTLRHDNFTNNTAYALSSLMNNATVYNTVMASYMGNYILKNFINTTIAQAQTQNVNVIITNVSLSIYQTSPFMVNATLTGLAIINSSQGTVAYPISATGSASLNGTQDLFYAEAADPHVIKAQAGAPVAVPIGNSIAIQGSTSPFMLASGTLVVEETGSPTCAGVPAGFQNGNYILVTQSAIDIPQNVCGMAGLVTGTANTATPLVPYLIYPPTTGASPTANVFALVQNGTKAILDGPAMALLNASQIQVAIQNGYYYASSLAPSYLAYGQDSLSQRSSAGMFSLNLLNRVVAYFNGGYSYVNVPTNSIVQPTSSITLVVWARTTGSGINAPRAIMIDDAVNYIDMCYQGATLGSLEVGGSQQLITGLGSCPSPGKWNQYVLTYDGANGRLYVNGVLTGNALMSGSLTYPGCGIYIGSYCPDGYTFNGLMADAQIYGNALTQSQVQQLYLNGMESPPVSNANLLGWWPLNGNANDLSGNGQNGIPNNMVTAQLINYAGDPLSGGAFYTNATNKVFATGNPGCSSLSNCGSNTVSAQLFLSSSPIRGNYSGKAARFTYGSGLSNPSPTNTPTGSAITEVAWVKPYNTEASGCNLWVINYGPDSGTGASMLLGVAQSSLRPALATWSNDYFPGTGPTLNLNSWNFLAGTISGSTATIYLNNQSESAALGMTPNVQHGQVSSSFGSLCSNSSVANLQMYNSVLTTQQLQALYRGGINGAPIAINTLTDWWPLNGNSTDYINSKNNMINSYTAYTTQYTNQSTGTSSGLAALHLADSALPNVASLGAGGNGYGYVQTAASSAFAPAKFTASFWMYPRTNGGNNAGGYTMLLGNVNPNEAGWNWAFQFGTSSGSLAFKGSGAGTTWGADTGVNKWYFITGVFDGSNWYLYNNATLVASCTSSCGSIGGSSSDMMFGSDGCISCGSGDLNGFFNGYLADARLYSGTAMTAAQVQQLYQNDSVAGLPANDVWPLSGGGPTNIAAVNQSVDIANNLNVGYFMSNTITCTLSNSIKSNCGVYYTQP